MRKDDQQGGDVKKNPPLHYAVIFSNNLPFPSMRLVFFHFINKIKTPLSLLVQPDREDELLRIEEGGGKVINWNGARVFGVLAMSRAIGTLIYLHIQY